MLNILIVDDQAVVRIALRNQLTKYFGNVQLNILFASNEKEALAQANKEFYMVIMNLHLGNEFGSQVYIKLCKINPKLENITVGFSSNLNDVKAWNEEIKSKFDNISQNEKPYIPPKMKYCLPKPASPGSIDSLITKFTEDKTQDTPSKTFTAS